MFVIFILFFKWFGDLSRSKRGIIIRQYLFIIIIIHSICKKIKITSFLMQDKKLTMYNYFSKDIYSNLPNKVLLIIILYYCLILLILELIIILFSLIICCDFRFLGIYVFCGLLLFGKSMEQYYYWWRYTGKGRHQQYSSCHSFFIFFSLLMGNAFNRQNNYILFKIYFSICLLSFNPTKTK